MTDFKMTFEGDPDVLTKGSHQLRSLCLKEVNAFEAYVQKTDPQFKDGLSRFERFAIEGYVYQKIKGNFDADTEENQLHMERQDGKTTGC